MVRHGPLRVRQPEWPSKKRCKWGQEGMQEEGERRKARRGEMGPKPHRKGGKVSLERRGVVSGENSQGSVGCHEGGEPAGALTGCSPLPQSSHVLGGPPWEITFEEERPTSKSPQAWQRVQPVGTANRRGREGCARCCSEAMGMDHCGMATSPGPTFAFNRGSFQISGFSTWVS